MNQLESKLHAIQNSKKYCKTQLEKEKDPNIRQKIEHYLEGLDKEEQETLNQLNITLEDITLTDEKPPKQEEQ